MAKAAEVEVVEVGRVVVVGLVVVARLDGEAVVEEVRQVATVNAVLLWDQFLEELLV